MIYVVDRIIPAVGKHVVAQDALTGRNVAVGIEEAACCGIVITALQVIEATILGGGLAIR